MGAAHLALLLAASLGSSSIDTGAVQDMQARLRRSGAAARREGASSASKTAIYIHPHMDVAAKNAAIRQLKQQMMQAAQTAAQLATEAREAERVWPELGAELTFSTRCAVASAWVPPDQPNRRLPPHPSGQPSLSQRHPEWAASPPPLQTSGRQ